MITAVWAYIDAVDTGARALAEREWLPRVPGWQIETAFPDFSPRCPDFLPAEALIRRPANALNVEIGAPAPRCRLQTPEEWGDADPRAARWLASGGEQSIVGPCSVHDCPRVKGRTP